MWFGCPCLGVLVCVCVCVCVGVVVLFVFGCMGVVLLLSDVVCVVWGMHVQVLMLVHMSLFVLASFSVVVFAGWLVSVCLV